MVLQLEPLVLPVVQVEPPVVHVEPPVVQVEPPEVGHLVPQATEQPVVLQLVLQAAWTFVAVIPAIRDKTINTFCMVDLSLVFQAAAVNSVQLPSPSELPLSCNTRTCRICSPLS